MCACNHGIHEMHVYLNQKYRLHVVGPVMYGTPTRPSLPVEWICSETARKLQSKSS